MGNLTNALDTFTDDAVDTLIENGASGAALLGSEAAATFNLEAGLSKWRSTLSASARNHVLVYGDSNSVGPETWRWPNAVKAALVTQTGRPDGGPGFRHLGLEEWAKSGWTVNSQGPLDIAPNGRMYSTFGPANILTWTPPAGLTAHDRFVIYGLDMAAVGIHETEYSDDGGAFVATAFNFAGSGYSLVTHPVTATIATSLRLRGVSTLAPSFAAGVAFYNGDGTAGPLVFHNLSESGSDTDVWTGSLESQADIVMPGAYLQPQGFSNRLALVDNLQPKLSIILTGAREFLHHEQQPLIGTKQQMPLERFEANLRRLVTKCRQYGDVLLMTPHGFKSDDPFTAKPLNNSQPAYAKRARKVAWDLDCGFIDINALWGSYDKMNARGFMLDAVHTSQFGQERLTNFLSKMFARIA